MSPFAPVSAIKKKSKRVGDQDLDSDEEISEGTDEDDDDINKDTMIVVCYFLNVNWYIAVILFI